MFESTPTENKSEQNTQSPVWGASIRDAVASAKAKLSKRKPRSTEGEESTSRTPTGGGLSKREEEKIREMFDPKAWRTLVRTPFVAARTITGRPCWNLEKEEEDTLASTTAASAEYFIQSDPKWLCLTLCLFNWGTVVASKMIANAALAKQEEDLKNANQTSLPK